MSERPLKIPPELEDVVNQVGEFIEYWGFKNVHGRIWAHLFLAPEPLDAADLIDRLGISKALVSMSISDLMEYEVIEIAGRTPRGTVTYRSNSELLNVIMNVLRKRERRMLSRVSSAVRLLQGLPTPAADEARTVPVSQDRIEVLGKFVSSAENCLDAMLQLNPAHFEAFTEFCDIPEPTK